MGRVHIHRRLYQQQSVLLVRIAMGLFYCRHTPPEMNFPSIPKALRGAACGRFMPIAEYGHNPSYIPKTTPESMIHKKFLTIRPKSGKCMLDFAGGHGI